ncbi:BAG family molecular chaperone regulator 1-like [Canna indica]|uniref:BAG family molecular chaperone regulator 1-like n=1 Tax=Canna indica TaxID=4628 RepID=A0AAQ3L5X8_9LILI|nr:BAG family molecular chaperone regulator 1-like [Canna indica]
MRSRTNGRADAAAAFSPIMESPPAEKVAEWEVRPGGMLVQKRDPDADAAAAAAPVPTIRVKVKYGAVYHEIYISTQATFGELKKALSSRTQLHPLDMKLMYKDKERESTAFLDTAGVKDKSKITLVEDPTAQAKRLLEMHKTDKMEKAAKSISTISLEVDRLASKVTALDEIVSKGGRVVDNDVTNLIELLMNELIKLDAIVADGDVKLQRKMQIKRVQKYVETLDMIKLKNGKLRTNSELRKELPQSPQQKNHQSQHPVQSQHQQSNSQRQQHPIQPQYQQQMQQKRDLQQLLNPYEQQNHHQHRLTPTPPPKQQTHLLLNHQEQPIKPPQKPVVVTTNWETFDSLFMPSTSTTTAAVSTPHARFDWEIF